LSEALRNAYHGFLSTKASKIPASKVKITVTIVVFTALSWARFGFDQVE
jgi:hypothetical protein